MFRRFRTVSIIAIIYLVALGGVYWYSLAKNPKTEYHIHAAFNVYRDNTLIDFSDSKYMHVEPCGDTSNLKRTKAEEQEEKAHLHDGIGDIVHTHRKNAKWSDLFGNMGYDVSGSVTGYVNGAAVSDVLHQKINAYDRALIMIGGAADVSSKLEMVPSVQRIHDVEAMQESC